MSAARYHRRTDDDTAISSMNSTNRSKYFILLYSVFLLWHGNGI